MSRDNYYIYLWEPGPIVNNEMTSVKKRWYVKHIKLKDDWGKVDWDRKTILIHESLKGWEYLSVLFHEAGHITLHTQDEYLVNRYERTSTSVAMTVFPKILDEIQNADQ